MASTPARQLTSHIEAFVDRAYGRHVTALDDLRARRYSVAHLLSDAIAGWVDLTEAILLPYKVFARADAPVVPIPLRLDATRGSGTGHISTPGLGDVSLTASDLKHGGGLGTIPGTAVTATVTTSGEDVHVVLSGLPKLALGSYGGSLKHGDILVANLIVTVTAAS